MSVKGGCAVRAGGPRPVGLGAPGRVCRPAGPVRSPGAHAGCCCPAVPRAAAAAAALAWLGRMAVLRPQLKRLAPAGCGAPGGAVGGGCCPPLPLRGRCAAVQPHPWRRRFPQPQLLAGPGRRPGRRSRGELPTHCLATGSHHQQGECGQGAALRGVCRGWRAAALPACRPREQATDHSQMLQTQDTFRGAQQLVMCTVALPVHDSAQGLCPAWPAAFEHRASRCGLRCNAPQAHGRAP